METKKGLREQRNIAQQRAIIYLKKLNQIESIIKNEQSKKTPSVLIVENIKDIIKEENNLL